MFLYYGLGWFVLDNLWFASLGIYFRVCKYCLLRKYRYIWVYSILHFFTNGFIIAGDSKEFIKSISETPQCVLGIKSTQLIWSGPWKPDIIKNKTPKPIIEKGYQNRPKPTANGQTIRTKHRIWTRNPMPSPIECDYEMPPPTPCDCEIGANLP